MSEYSEMNLKRIKINYPFDVWMNVDEAKMISVSSWCAECLKEKKYEWAVVVYSGESLCQNHFEARVGEKEN